MNELHRVWRWLVRQEYLLAGLLLAAAVLLFWWRVWIPSLADRMHFSDDILIKDYATRLGLFRILLDGALPFWDPYQFGGWPGIANCEAGFFYPFNWLLIPFVHSPEFAYQVTQWTVLLHFWIAGFGAYVFARWWGLSPWGAALAAVAFTFCGFHCAHKKHTNMLYALVWFPWIMLVLEAWLRKARTRILLLVTGLFALSFLAGHPQSALYMTLIVFARMLHAGIQQAWHGDRFVLVDCMRKVVPGGLALALAVGLTAVQWFPTVELIQQGERSDADQYVRSAEFSLPTHELMDVFLPEALRHWSQVEVFYWGIAPLLLTVLALVRGHFRTLDYFLLGLMTTSILFALGESIFAYDVSYLLLPGVAWVRAPSRWIYFAGFPIALFAGRALDWVVNRDSAVLTAETMQRYRVVLAGAGVVAMVLTVLVIFIVAGEGWRDAAMAASNPAWVSHSGNELRLLFTGVLLTLLFAGTCLLFFYLTQEHKCSPVAFGVLIILLTWFDLGTHYRLLDLKPGTGGYEMDESVEVLQQADWNQRTKVFLGGGGIRDRYHGAAQGFRELDGNSPLVPRLNIHLREDSAMLEPMKPNMALLDLLGVQSLFLDYPFMPLQYEPVSQSLILSDTPSVRARVIPDRFVCPAFLQRDLLRLQGFPREQIALVEGEKSTNINSVPNALFPKPFLLASASADAVQLGAHLIVDGENVFEPLGTAPGYYLAFANPVSGQIERRSMFNLMASSSDPLRPGHQRLRQFIESIPDGYIVFAAIRDNAANVLLPEGVAALRGIGASVDVRSGFRYAHAIVGRKGAPVGSALEIVSPTEAIVIQTQKALYTSGSVAPPPSPEWSNRAEQPDSWYLLLRELHDNDIAEEQFWPMGGLQPEPDQPAAVVPMAVYSSNKIITFDGESQRGMGGILIGGENVSLNGKGYNLVRYDPQSRTVVAAEAFDLVKDFINRPDLGFAKENPAENIRMQRFIQETPEGMYILGALKEEGMDLLLPETIAVLNAEGSEIMREPNPDRRKIMTHAFILVKGRNQCVESIQAGLDALVFSRWKGGPSLTRSDLPLAVQGGIPEQPIWTYPADPMEEVVDEAYTPAWANTTPVMDVWPVEEESPNSLQISGVASFDGIVMVNEILYPGWSAYVNGRRAPVQRVNYFFRGLEVTSGPNVISMSYVPIPFILGIIVSLLALIIFCNLFAFSRWVDDLIESRR